MFDEKGNLQRSWLLFFESVDKAISVSFAYFVPISAGMASPDLSKSDIQEVHLSGTGVIKILPPAGINGAQTWELILVQDAAGGTPVLFDAVAFPNNQAGDVSGDPSGFVTSANSKTLLTFQTTGTDRVQRHRPPYGTVTK